MVAKIGRNTFWKRVWIPCTLCARLPGFGITEEEANSKPGIRDFRNELTDWLSIFSFQFSNKNTKSS